MGTRDEFFEATGQRTPPPNDSPGFFTRVTAFYTRGADIAGDLFGIKGTCNGANGDGVQGFGGDSGGIGVRGQGGGGAAAGASPGVVGWGGEGASNNGVEGHGKLDFSGVAGFAGDNGTGVFGRGGAPSGPGIRGIGGGVSDAGPGIGNSDGVYGIGSGSFSGVAGFGSDGIDANNNVVVGTGVFGKGGVQQGAPDKVRGPGVRGIGGDGPITGPAGPVGVWGQGGPPSANPDNVLTGWPGVVGQAYNERPELDADGVQGIGNHSFSGVAGFGDVHSGSDSGSGTGVFGLGGAPSGPGVRGIGNGGPNTKAPPKNAVGVLGQGGAGNSDGVLGFSNGTGAGVHGVARSSTAGLGLAGHFNGNVTVTAGDVAIGGTLTKSAGGFRIDHPLYPEDQYLQHSFVESPEMMNVYCGKAVLDDAGEAEVKLPDWFEALNRDFRYQLTCVGKFAPVFISKEIAHNKFVIAGGAPGIKVCWQVTGVRHDAYAEQHRLAVEIDKDADATHAIRTACSPKSHAA